MTAPGAAVSPAQEAAVAKVLREALCRADETWDHHDQTDDFPCTRCTTHAAHVAAALLASDEFAEVLAALSVSDALGSTRRKVAAEALQEAADAIDDHSDCDCEGGDHLTRLVSADWLRARADAAGGRQ